MGGWPGEKSGAMSMPRHGDSMFHLLRGPRRESEQSNLECHFFISSSGKKRKTHARSPRATVTNHNPANPPLTVGHERKSLQRSAFLAVHHSVHLKPKGFLGQSCAPGQVLALFILQECCGSPQGKGAALLQCF